VACRRDEERIDKRICKQKKPTRNRVFWRMRRAATAESIFLYIDSLGGRSDIFEAASKLVQWFGRGRGAKFSLSHWLYHWLLTLRIALPRIRVIICVMLSDVNLHYVTLAARCPVSGCWPSCINNSAVEWCVLVVDETRRWSFNAVG